MTSDEISEFLTQLAVNDLSGKKTKFATNDHVESWRMALMAAGDHKWFHQLKALELGWQSISTDYTGVDRDDLGPNFIFRFIEHINAGQYPPPEMLLVISNLLKYYVTTGGNISLDQAFFGRSHAKTKSIAHLSKDWMAYQHFDRMLQDVSRHAEWEAEWDIYPFREPMWSIEQCADEFLTHRHRNELDAMPDADSFLRGFRRWKHENSG